MGMNIQGQLPIDLLELRTFSTKDKMQESKQQIMKVGHDIPLHEKRSMGEADVSKHSISKICSNLIVFDTFNACAAIVHLPRPS